jgi:hypothetical protein
MEIPDVAISCVVVNILFPVLSLMVVGLRMHTRIFVIKNVGLDDYLITMATVSTWISPHEAASFFSKWRIDLN